jgi:ATPase subunit of ABC transporter with duplicated ATPase domains
LRRPNVLLLDEPTNNLDLDARRRLYDAVVAWTGVLVIVSHDRDGPGRRTHRTHHPRPGTNRPHRAERRR